MTVTVMVQVMSTDNNNNKIIVVNLVIINSLYLETTSNIKCGYHWRLPRENER